MFELWGIAKACRHLGFAGLQKGPDVSQTIAVHGSKREHLIGLLEAVAKHDAPMEVIAVLRRPPLVADDRREATGTLYSTVLDCDD